MTGAQMNIKYLELVYARIDDLECRCNSIEENKLYELYGLAERLLNGGELTNVEINRYKLQKYQTEAAPASGDVGAQAGDTGGT